MPNKQITVEGMTSKPQWTLAHISTLPLNQSLDRDWSYEIKFLRRKATTNLDSVLKSRDITLLTKVHIVKAMLFPVVMYRCEIWTIKKAESQRIDTFKLWCWRRLFRVPWIARSNQSILKQVNSESCWKTDAEVLILCPLDVNAGRVNIQGVGGSRGWDV